MNIIEVWQAIIANPSLLAITIFGEVSAFFAFFVIGRWHLEQNRKEKANAKTSKGSDIR